VIGYKHCSKTSPRVPQIQFDVFGRCWKLISQILSHVAEIAGFQNRRLRPLRGRILTRLKLIICFCANIALCGGEKGMAISGLHKTNLRMTRKKCLLFWKWQNPSYNVSPFGHVSQSKLYPIDIRHLKIDVAAKHEKTLSGGATGRRPRLHRTDCK
jgi:hypothetical protein